MIKKVLAIFFGVITGMIVVMLGDFIAHKFTPLPPNLNSADPKEIIAFVKTIPNTTFVIMQLFWLLSAISGGIVAAIINANDWQKSVMNVGIILMLATLMNLYLIPGHPIWMWVITILGFIPLAYLGGKIVASINLSKMN
jgi:Na+-driven multidrug efflux pump